MKDHLNPTNMNSIEEAKPEDVTVGSVIPEGTATVEPFNSITDIFAVVL